MRNKIIIISGDPNSINSELIFKSWKKLKKQLRNKIYLITNYNMLKSQFKKLKYSIKLEQVKNINENAGNNALKILNLDLKFKDPFKVQNKSASKFVIDSLNYAHSVSLNKNVMGFIVY